VYVLVQGKYRDQRRLQTLCLGQTDKVNCGLKT
jgi:hypothetical protein